LKHIFFVAIVIISFLSCSKSDSKLPGNDKPVAVVNSFPHPDHIIFVWLENKDYDSIVNSSSAPYINSLVSQGTLFTNTSALMHPSYPNYVSFFAGDPNGVSSDKCIDSSTLTTPNLYTALNTVGKSFAWYSEGLPAVGSTVCKAGLYVEKHNPTTIFANVPASANKPFSAFPADYSQLENVVCISPNLQNDMHDGSISKGDTWLKTNLAPLADWCKTHNSVFVIYFDENEGAEGNKIPVIAVGQNVKVNYQDSTAYTHYNWTRSISAMYSANETWTTNLNASDSIKNCWK